MRALADSPEPPLGDDRPEEGGNEMNLGETPPKDVALLAVAVVVMLGGAVALIGGWIGAAVAIPLIALGIALVVIARSDVQRRHRRQLPGT
jgi:hypothetical protein